jgi:hypothetical protein
MTEALLDVAAEYPDLEPPPVYVVDHDRVSPVVRAVEADDARAARVIE